MIEKATSSAKIKEYEWKQKTNKTMYFLSLAVKLDEVVACDTPKQVIDKL